MSATGRGTERNAFDFYETPFWVVHRFLDAVGETFGSRILEPCAGGGAIVTAVNAWHDHHGADRPEWLMVELQPEKRDLLRGLGKAHCGDFFSVTGALKNHPRDRILGNPAFSVAEQFVLECVRLARSWDRPAPTSMLLRLDFLASAKRFVLMKEIGVPDVAVLPDRPSFTGDGSTDSCQYAWLTWPEQYQQIGDVKILACTPLAERKRS